MVRTKESAEWGKVHVALLGMTRDHAVRLCVNAHRTELVDDEGTAFVPYALLTEDNGTVTERQYQRECKNQGGKDYQTQKGEHHIKQTLNQMLETAHRITMFHVAGLTVTVYTVVQHLSFLFF